MSRRTQPHRKGARQPSAALDAMRAGRPFSLAHKPDQAGYAAKVAARRGRGRRRRKGRYGSAILKG